MMQVSGAAAVLFVCKVSAIQISSLNGGNTGFNSDLVDDPHEVIGKEPYDEPAVNIDPPKLHTVVTEEASANVAEQGDDTVVQQQAANNAIPAAPTVQHQDEVNTEEFKDCHSVFQYQKRNRYGSGNWYTFLYMNERGEDLTRAWKDGGLRLGEKDNAQWLYSTDIEKLQSGAIYTRGKASDKPVYQFRSDGEERTSEKFTDLYRRKTWNMKENFTDPMTVVGWEYEVWDGQEKTWNPVLDLTSLANNDPKEANNIAVNHQIWSYSTKLDNLLSPETYSKSLFVNKGVVGKRVSEWRTDGTPRNTEKSSDGFRMKSNVYTFVVQDDDFYSGKDDYPVETIDLYENIPREQRHLLSELGDWFEPCAQNSSLANGAPSHLVEQFSQHLNQTHSLPKCVKMNLPNEAAFLEKFKGQPVWSVDHGRFASVIGFDVTERNAKVKFAHNERGIPRGTQGRVTEKRDNGDLLVGGFDSPIRPKTFSFQPTKDMKRQTWHYFQDKGDGTFELTEQFFQALPPQDALEVRGHIVTSVNNQKPDTWPLLQAALMGPSVETVTIPAGLEFPENRDLGIFLEHDGITFRGCKEKTWADRVRISRYNNLKYRFTKVNSHVIAKKGDFEAAIATCKPGDKMVFELRGQASIEFGLKSKTESVVVPKDAVHTELQLVQGKAESHPSLSFIKAANQAQALSANEVRIAFRDIQEYLLGDLKKTLGDIPAKDIRAVDAGHGLFKVICTVEKDKLGLKQYH